MAEIPDVEVEGDEVLVAWRRDRRPGSRQFALVTTIPDLTPEDVNVRLGLAAVVDGEVRARVPLVFTRRIRIDAAAHLYTDSTSALTAHVSLDPVAKKMNLALTFDPTGRDVHRTLDEAIVLRSAAEGHLALVLPDGSLSPDRIALPAELQLEESLVDFLELLRDVSSLAGVDLVVPSDPDTATIRELLNARRLLRGEEVRGRWKDGELVLDLAAQEVIGDSLAVGARHQLSFDTDMALSLEGTTIPVGLVRRVFDDAVVESIEPDGATLVVRLRAFDGSATMVMSPLTLPGARESLPTRIELAPDAFEALTRDLDAPARKTKLRDLV